MALAKEAATILGTATDPSGSVIANVKVTLTHVETGEARTVVTNETGQYVAANLPIGHSRRKRNERSSRKLFCG
jgi:hypothetical protein